MNIPNVISSQSTNQIRPSEIPRTANYSVSTAPDPLPHFPSVFFFASAGRVWGRDYSTLRNFVQVNFHVLLCVSLHVLSLTLNFTSSIAELTLDDLQGAGFFQMFWEVLPLDRILSTFVWTFQGILLADRPVLIGHCDVGGFVGTVLAGEWTVGAIICLVPLELTSLETITTGVRTGYCHKLALSLKRVLAQMSVETAQLSRPLTPQALVWAANFELVDFALEILVRGSIQIFLLAHRTGLSL